MIDFTVKESRCISCNECVRDCPVMIIESEGGIPFVRKEREAICIKCQHCLAVCPTAAVSICGVNPDECVPVSAKAEPEALEALMRSRRSVRRYRQENLDKGVIDDLIKVSANCPSGKNDRKLLFTVIDDIDEMNRFREKVYGVIEEKINNNCLPEKYAFFASTLKAYKGGKDIIFRGAPHFIVASASADECATPVADSFIGLNYFELYSASRGVGAVWVGFFMYLIDFVEDMNDILGIPTDHRIGYALIFGKPDVEYHRGVKRNDVLVHRPRF
jgi:nitroreductase/NAD-dependent dihydropyrimidine dehydrogenase PreA subunit